MMMLSMLVLIILLAEGGHAKPIVRGPDDVKVSIGGEAILTCQVDHPYKFCSFYSPTGTTFSMDPQVEYQDGRISFAGSHDDDEEKMTCGVKISPVTEADGGTWKCKITVVKEGVAEKSENQATVTVIESLISPDSLMPLYAPEGEKAVFRCSFKQTHSTHLMWWKNNHNFYSYAYGTEVIRYGHGISPETFKQENCGQTIILSNVTQDSAGLYKCVATFTDYSANTPIVTDIRQQYLSVVRQPKGPPTIKGSITDGILTAMCQAPSAIPPATLQWYRNNEPVAESQVSQDSGIILRLTLPLGEEEISLSCTATVEVGGGEPTGKEMIFWEKTSVTAGENQRDGVLGSSGERLDYMYYSMFIFVVYTLFVLLVTV